MGVAGLSVSQRLREKQKGVVFLGHQGLET